MITPQLSSIPPASVIKEERVKLPYRACFVYFGGRNNIAGERSPKITYGTKAVKFQYSTRLARAATTNSLVL